MEIPSTLASSAQCCGSRAKHTKVEKSKMTHRLSLAKNSMFSVSENRRAIFDFSTDVSFLYIFAKFLFCLRTGVFFPVSIAPRQLKVVCSVLLGFKYFLKLSLTL